MQQTVGMARVTSSNIGTAFAGHLCMHLLLLGLQANFKQAGTVGDGRPAMPKTLHSNSVLL